MNINVKFVLPVQGKVKTPKKLQVFCMLLFRVASFLKNKYLYHFSLEVDGVDLLVDAIPNNLFKSSTISSSKSSESSLSPGSAGSSESDPDSEGSLYIPAENRISKKLLS